jgi:methylmalonyl-CoA mutase
MAGRNAPFGAGFVQRNLADWQALVEKDLKGGDPERLVTTTEDGLRIPPLCTEGELLQVPPRAESAPERLARIGAEGNGRVAEAISYALNHGATGILLDLSTPRHSDGLAVDPADWDSIFAELGDSGSLHLRANAGGIAHARAWLESEAFGQRTGCSLGLDPFAVATLTGAFDELAAGLAGAAELGAEALNHRAHPRPFVLDAAPYAGAGATTAQAVGCLLAGTVEVLRALEQASVDSSRAFDAIGWGLRLDPRFFEQVAALRALRILHLQIARACGIESPPALFLMALPAERMLSRRDPWVNILRQTATCFAGLVGGADAVGAFAFDSTLQASSELGRRVARNTPTILDEESHLARVQDPAAGSWFLDRFTRDLCRAGWSFFQAIEQEGGFAQALSSGWLLDRFAARRVLREERLAKRNQPRTGVSEFANLHEELPSAVAAKPSPSGRAWPRFGYDDAFEALRSAVDRHAVSQPRPRVFLARAGNPAEFSAREAWIRSLVAAAGIEAVSGDPEGDQKKQFAESGAKTAILTADDATLVERGPELARVLGQTGHVWAAGKPKDALTKSGVRDFVHVGIDAVDVLGRLLSEQGVKR